MADFIQSFCEIKIDSINLASFEDIMNLMKNIKHLVSCRLATLKTVY